MKQNGKCPKCGSGDILADVKAVDRAHGNLEKEMSLATYRWPGAFLFKGKQETTVSAWLCGGCGYVEFYADNPAALKL